MKRLLLFFCIGLLFLTSYGQEDENKAYGKPVNIRGWNGTDWELIRVDASTNSLQVIDYAHHEIHSGSHYFIKNYDGDMDTGDSLIFCVTTPNTTKWTHMLFNIESTNILEVKVYEGSVYTGGGAVTAFNSNRNSANTTGMTIVSNPTTYTLGTLLQAHKSGADGIGNRVDIGGSAGRESELVLKQNTVYFWILVSGADDNVVDYSADFYEHTDK